MKLQCKDQQFDDLPPRPDKPTSKTTSTAKKDHSPALSQSIFRLTAITIAKTMNRPTLPINKA